MKPSNTYSVVLTFLAAAICCAKSFATTTDSLDKKASWQIPTAAAVKLSVDEWLTKTKLNSVQQARVDAIWMGLNDNVTSDGLLLRTIETFAVAEPDAQRMLNVCRKRTSIPHLPDVAFLSDEKYSAFFKNNLRLFYGQWLGLNQLYDEVQQTLDGLEPTDVVDPSALLFFQAVSHHRLLNKEVSLPILERLLENDELIPLRYSTMARLMEADIKPLKEDSLDEVSRLMDNIKVRLGHGRAGTRVRKEEDDVIAKLDKMIEDLEKQAQQSSSSSTQDGNPNNQSTEPMNDSMPGGVSGPGNVDPKKLRDDAEWGDLPPKEREKALQRLSKDLPSHYRSVIEQYFQKLAKEEE